MVENVTYTCRQIGFLGLNLWIGQFTHTLTAGQPQVETASLTHGIEKENKMHAFCAQEDSKKWERKRFPTHWIWDWLWSIECCRQNIMCFEPRLQFLLHFHSCPLSMLTHVVKPRLVLQKQPLSRSSLGLSERRPGPGTFLYMKTWSFLGPRFFFLIRRSFPLLWVCSELPCIA